MRVKDVAKLSLFSLFLACLGLAPGAGAAGEAKAAGGSWQVLILDRLSASSKDSPARYATTWSSGSTSKRFDGAVAALGGHLVTLKVNNVKEHGSCPLGKFPFSIDVDQLVAEPLGGGQAKVLFGQSALASAKDLMRDHLASCDGLKPLPFAPDTTESYERTKINLLSVYNNYLGVEIVAASLPYGKPSPMAVDNWGAYQLDKEPIAPVSKKGLPAGAASEATSKFLKLPASERDSYAPADVGQFVYVPSAGGVAVEFGVPGTVEASRGTVKVVRVERPAGLGDEYSKMAGQFVAAHAKLLPWDKLSFYTVAPDRSAVVYGQDGKLYWQALSAKPKQIGQLKELRGWQWVAGGKLSQTERKLVGL